MGDVYTNPPQSRNEAILRATIDGTEYTAPPQSRIEDLLLELKEAIEQGGTGEGDMKKSIYDSDNSVATAGGIKMFVNQKIGTLPQRVGSLETTAGVLEGEVVSIENTLGGLGTASTKNSTSVVTESSDLVESGAVKDIVGWGNKNMLDLNNSGFLEATNVIASKNDGVVTFTNNANSDTFYRVMAPIDIPDSGEYILSGCPANGSTSTYFIYIQASDFSETYRDVGDGVTCQLDKTKTYNCYIKLSSGYGDGKVFYPMLRKAGTSDAFEPYHASVEDTLRDAEVVEGKNLLPVTLKGIKELNTSGTWSGNIYTLNDVALTIETDGDKVLGIDVNGTASYNIIFKLALPTGGDILTGCPTGGGWSSYILYQSSGATDSGEGATGVLTNSYISIYVKSGYNVQHKKFYPMIRKATETDPTYEPYYVPLKDVVPQKCDNSTIAPTENGSTASQAYAVREHFIRDGAFCTVTQAISSGGTLTEGTNYTSGDVASAINNVVNLIVTPTETGDIILSYPNGFNKDNTIVISIGIEDGNGDYRYGIGTHSNAFYRGFVVLMSDGIKYSVYDTATLNNYKHKISIMRLF